MLKYNLERCSKHLTFNPRQEEQSRVSSVIVADTPIRAIKMPKKKVLISANRMSTSVEEQQSISSMLYADSQLSKDKENSRHSINEMNSSRAHESEVHNDSHFYLQTSVCEGSAKYASSGKRRMRRSTRREVSLLQVAEAYQLQARSIIYGAKVLTRFVERTAFKQISRVVEQKESKEEQRKRILKRLIGLSRNLHTKEPFSRIVEIQASQRRLTLQSAVKVFCRYAGRQFIYRLRMHYGGCMDQDIRNISRYLNDKQQELAASQRKIAARALCLALRNILSRQSRIAKFVTRLLTELQLLKPQTSRFASSTAKPSKPYFMDATKCHLKSYSFSRIVQDEQ